MSSIARTRAATLSSLALGAACSVGGGGGGAGGDAADMDVFANRDDLEKAGRFARKHGASATR